MSVTVSIVITVVSVTVTIVVVSMAATTAASVAFLAILVSRIMAIMVSIMFTSVMSGMVVRIAVKVDSCCSVVAVVRFVFAAMLTTTVVCAIHPIIRWVGAMGLILRDRGSVPTIRGAMYSVPSGIGLLVVYAVSLRKWFLVAGWSFVLMTWNLMWLSILARSLPIMSCTGRWVGRGIPAIVIISPVSIVVLNSPVWFATRYV